MNINSRLFDSIRIGSSEAEAVVDSDAPRCDHPGCARAGEFRAPKGRGREGQFFLFCKEHVKAYNATYNYFAGMDDDALAAYQKQEEIGHRPTWKLGVNSQAARMSQRGRLRNGEAGPDMHDAFNLFGARSKQQAAQPEARVGVVARKALDTLGLDDTADSAAIKARYKELVKRFHPDANGGDRSREGTLQEILKAYQQLKSVGMV
ncbi:J domain-containing protein [Bosea sp. F3-2]|uniref:J domain-containing protein n=1 Tax=Bosea sp. F3-2 TaxID=2599640 RepID=UPI0011EDA732|nr:J domain-containing protein [Bosea sp. F3-2]QEL24145.1 J domain-containing protein [Bosea sp. F3-2]